MKYYVLGSKNNEMLSHYREKYYHLLCHKLQEISIIIAKSNNSNTTNNNNTINSASNNTEVAKNIQILLHIWEKNREFILNADYSVLVNFLYTEYVEHINNHLQSKEEALSILAREIELYLSWKTDQLLMNIWYIISKTDIRLTHRDLNPYAELDAHPDHKDTGGVQWYWQKTIEEFWL